LLGLQASACAPSLSCVTCAGCGQRGEAAFHALLWMGVGMREGESARKGWRGSERRGGPG
jgi:hypothetical protein